MSPSQAMELESEASEAARKSSRAIDVPLAKWRGNCYGIAQRLADDFYEKGEAVFGHYYGPIDEDGYFGERSGLNQHGWIEFEDEKIIDPTRWVFTNKAPFLYITHKPDDEYDRAGQKLRESLTTPPPEDGEGDVFEVDFGDEVEPFIYSLLDVDHQRNEYYFNELGWIANLPVKTLGEHAESIYKTLINHETDYLGALIPIDHKTMVLEEDDF